MEEPKYKHPLGILTVDELKEIYEQWKKGDDIDYQIEHVMGEILFRDMLQQWEIDTQDLAEEIKTDNEKNQ
jgi:hypothetical protein